jgi:hypothetical protein
VREWQIPEIFLHYVAQNRIVGRVLLRITNPHAAVPGCAERQQSSAPLDADAIGVLKEILAVTRNISDTTETLTRNRNAERTVAVSAAAAPSDGEHAGAPIFRVCGDGWLVQYSGTANRVRNLIGMRYIAHLLARPNTHMSGVELQLAVKGIGRDMNAKPDALADEEALRNYRGEYEQTTAELERARKEKDLTEVARLTEAQRVLAEQVEKVRGFGRDRDRRSREVAGPAEKARVAVKQAIDRAVRHLRGLNPPLAKHLKTSIQTGDILTYVPDVHVPWEL